ncbi:MAG TPA: transposase [Gammaproteobacteria bacterium]|nr:transposase [Gammaproteobacteria bacterium]
MARLARVVAAGVPYHITQRGNRRQAVYFAEEDYHAYIELMAAGCAHYGVAVWAYCLMTNHVHLIAVPEAAEGLTPAISEAHRRYSRHINFREGWRGHLWQGRFASFPMDEVYLLAAARYVERNPVEAGMEEAAGDYPWSSARAHLTGRDDELVQVRPLLSLVPDWQRFLEEAVPEAETRAFQTHERTGRPLGSEPFVEKLETLVGRSLKRRKPGPKPREGEGEGRHGIT